MKRLITLVLVFLSLSCLARGKGKEIKLLYWNIQNGMWHDQGNNYDAFVEYVKSLDPDICVWAEAESRYITDTGVKMKIPEDQYLPWNWPRVTATNLRSSQESEILSRRSSPRSIPSRSSSASRATGRTSSWSMEPAGRRWISEREGS